MFQESVLFQYIWWDTFLGTPYFTSSNLTVFAQITPSKRNYRKFGNLLRKSQKAAMSFCVILRMLLTMFIHNKTPKSFAIFISIWRSNFGIPVSVHIFSIHPFFSYFLLTFNYLRPGYIKTWLCKIRIKKGFPSLIGKNRMCYKFNDISILGIYPNLYETWCKIKLKNQKSSMCE